MTGNNGIDPVKRSYETREIVQQAAAQFARQGRLLRKPAYISGYERRIPLYPGTPVFNPWLCAQLL